MSANVKQLTADALRLSPEERADLADRLWISLDSQADIDVAWAIEIENRIRQIDNKSVELIKHEDVVAELRARYEK